jgi:hypothetical protein
MITVNAKSDDTCYDCGGPVNDHGQCDSCDRREGKL